MRETRLRAELWVNWRRHGSELEMRMGGEPGTTLQKSVAVMGRRR